MRSLLYVVAILVALASGGCGTDATPVAASVASPSPPATTATLPSPAPDAGAVLPDAKLTPGEVFPGATAAQVCVSGYAASVRNVTRDQYVAVYAAYGIPYPEPTGAYELDHLIPLELGGDNSDRNLWPEPASPAPGFHQKDELEDYLHAAVCAGRMQLGDAQRGIATNWAFLFQEYLHT